MISLATKTYGSSTNPSIVFLHGFPFNHKIWLDFIAGLDRNFYVVLIDLPGFGESPLLPTPFSLEDVGESVVATVTAKQIIDPIIVGHSLGGYVALAMAAANPSFMRSLVLFHSTAYADSQEKKDSRNKVIDVINRNGVIPFVSNFTAPLFAFKEHPAIEGVSKIAREASAETVINYTMAMRDRRAQSSLLKDFPKPILFISGEQDASIPVSTLKEQASLNANIRLEVLPDCGHMGMLEQPEAAREILKDFGLRK